MCKILCLFLLILISLNLGLSEGKGTTVNLEERFIGRCSEYQELPYSSRSIKAINCKDLFKLFSAPFIYKDECEWERQPFDEYFRTIKEDTPKDKVLFWSKTKPLADQIGNGKKYFSLEYTMAGYVADKLVWCGQKQVTGINYYECLRNCGEKPSASYEYWIRASANFAKSAKGVVTVLLNGSLNNTANEFAFNEKSTFATVELENLSPIKVTEVKVILVHNLDGPISENCLSDSIKKLEKKIQRKHLKFKCIEDPIEVKFLYCSQNPDREDCKITLSSVNLPKKRNYIDKRRRTI